MKNVYFKIICLYYMLKGGLLGVMPALEMKSYHAAFTYLGRINYPFIVL